MVADTSRLKWLTPTGLAALQIGTKISAPSLRHPYPGGVHELLCGIVDMAGGAAARTVDVEIRGRRLGDRAVRLSRLRGRCRSMRRQWNLVAHRLRMVVQHLVEVVRLLVEHHAAYEIGLAAHQQL